MNRRTFLISVVAVTLMAGAGTATAATGVLSDGSDGSAADAEPGAALASVETATVRRGDLTADREFDATVSFGDRLPLPTAAAGTITQQRPVGAVVGFGDTLARIDDKPVFLGQGAMPMYRELSLVDTDAVDENGNRLELVNGFDVAQLQAFLLDAGFDANGWLEVTGTFSKPTENAVKSWQESVGLPVTGRVDSSQLVFSPAPVRIASELRVGAPFEGIEVNNAEPAVLVDTSNRDRSALPVDTTVQVALPDSAALVGAVTDQKQRTAEDGSQVWRTTVGIDGDLPGDATSAKVTVTETVAKDVRFVPVGALLALSEGGFAVEIPTESGTTLVPVDVGEVLDGQAEVDGDIEEGDEVVIPE